MMHERAIFGSPDPDWEAAEITLARADVAASRVYPHSVSKRGLEIRGEPDMLPLKEWLATQND